MRIVIVVVVVAGHRFQKVALATKNDDDDSAPSDDDEEEEEATPEKSANGQVDRKEPLRLKIQKVEDDQSKAESPQKSVAARRGSSFTGDKLRIRSDRQYKTLPARLKKYNAKVDFHILYCSSLVNRH